MNWYGSNPYVLLVGNLQIDLDEPKWLQTYADQLAKPSTWVLAQKPQENERPQPVLVMWVDEGEVPTYRARHIGVMGADVETVVYGISKVRANGSVESYWVLPDGEPFEGEDVATRLGY